MDVSQAPREKVDRPEQFVFSIEFNTLRVMGQGLSVFFGSETAVACLFLPFRFLS